MSIIKFIAFLLFAISKATAICIIGWLGYALFVGLDNAVVAVLVNPVIIGSVMLLCLFISYRLFYKVK